MRTVAKGMWVLSVLLALGGGVVTFGGMIDMTTTTHTSNIMLGAGIIMAGVIVMMIASQTPSGL